MLITEAEAFKIKATMNDESCYILSKHKEKLVILQLIGIIKNKK